MSEQVIKKKPFTRSEIRIGRNHLCYCGSQKKYKRCCLKSVQLFEHIMNQRKLEEEKKPTQDLLVLDEAHWEKE